MSVANSLAETLRVGLGVAGLGALSACWIALLTWSSLDPSLTSVASQPPRNWLGLPGAYIADAGLQVLGLAVFVVLLAPMYWAIALLRSEPLPAFASKIVSQVLGITLLAAAAAAVPALPRWPLPYGMGGIIGDRISGLASGLVGPHLGDGSKPVLALAFALVGVVVILNACGVRIVQRHAHNPAPSRQSRAHSQFEPSFNSPSSYAAGSQDQRGVGRTSAALKTSHFEPYWEDTDRSGRHDAQHPQSDSTARTGPTRSSARVSDRTRRQYGPYASSAHELESDPNQDGAPDFDDWTEASSGGIAARFAPQDNAPHALQSALSLAFGLEITRSATQPVSRTLTRPSARHLAQAYRRPSLNLLARSNGQRAPSGYAQNLIRGNGRLLGDALAEYGIDGTLRDVEHGPVLTTFVFEIARGTNLSRVIALADDIASNVGAPAVRIVERAGPNLVAIELPNLDRAPVLLRDCLESEAYRSSFEGLPVALGRSTTGEPIIANLAHLPGLLVSGGEGMSKAAGLNAMILSLIYRHGPEDCRFLLIDPRMVDLAVYDGIPHLLTPVVGDPHKAITALAWCVREMEERVKRMAAIGVRNIDLFNNRIRNAKKRGEALQRTVQTGFDERTGKARFEKEALDLEPMPYIVIVVEELADLMGVAGRELEGSVGRLAKAARAVGIHLIIATDRPAGDILTATIKSNMPARLSYKAASRSESRQALGHEGAEQLMPGGDSLLVTGTGHPVRVHGPMVSVDEVANVTMALKEHGTTNYNEDVLKDHHAAKDPTTGRPATGYGSQPATAHSTTRQETTGHSATGPHGNVQHGYPAVGDPAVGPSAAADDELYDRAVAIAVRDGAVSIGHLQATLKIKTGWAANVVGRLEADGVVGPADQRGFHRLRRMERGVA